MALRTGAEYLQALRDGREVYLDGRRVKDVTTEPGLSIVAHTFARMYDLVAQNQEAMTCLDEEGQQISGTWLQPRDRDQLGWRRLFTETIARHTGGLFGRPQDYVPLFHLGLLDVKTDFSRGDKRFEQNIERYWRHARDKDLMLSHGFIDVQSHPSRAINETVVPRIVARNADGIVVRGVKTVATFATHADEVLIGSVPRTGLTEDHVVYFSIPIATPGLRVVARTVYGTGNAFDHPVSQYGDENDCMIIFDDVLVPWERVFSIADEKFCATIFPRITEWAHWSILVRLAIKAEVLAGLYALIPEMLGRAQQPQSQEAVGEILRYLVTLRAFIHASEDQSTVTPAGHCMPNPQYVTAGRVYSVEHYRRVTGYPARHRQSGVDQHAGAGGVRQRDDRPHAGGHVRRPRRVSARPCAHHPTGVGHGVRLLRQSSDVVRAVQRPTLDGPTRIVGRRLRLRTLPATGARDGRNRFARSGRRRCRQGRPRPWPGLQCCRPGVRRRPGGR